MKKLWEKNWKLDEFIEAFETKGDLVMDQMLVSYDVYGTLAHAFMLEKIGIINKKELAEAQKGLSEILKKHDSGTFTLTAGDEDIHTKIENYLTEQSGSVGKKIHTGRSRNDQVLTMLRLFAQDQSLHVQEELLLLIEVFCNFVKEYGNVPMPGYTHMQKAMPSTVGMWAESFIESLFDDLRQLKESTSIISQSPLGSGAGYGVSLSIDREYTAELLGFEKVQNNPMYCQNSRSKFDVVLLSAFIQIGMTLNKCATDILLFTTTEFGFFDVSDSLISGSSIMPQKKNVDVAELIRSKIHSLLGFYTQLVSLSSNLPSGYNRDVQDTKQAFVNSFSIITESIIATKFLIQGLTPDKTVLGSAMTSELYATDAAFSLVKKGMTFRDAYQKVGSHLESVSVSKKSHQYNVSFEAIAKQLSSEKKHLSKQQRRQKNIKKNLLKGGEKNE